MGRSNSARRLAAAAASLGVLATAIALGSPGAMATFPGANGKIAFSSDRQGGSRIFTMAPNGSDGKRITDGSDDNVPAFSPSGKWIVFVRGGGPKPGLYRVKADGSKERRLTADTSDDNPAFSPDGERIVFARGRPMVMKRGVVLAGPDIWVMRVDGSHEHPLTSNPEEDDYPAFSPNGRKIAFDSRRDGDSEIFVMRADGTNEHAITANNRDDYDPNYSPNGEKITFAADREGQNFDIFAMDADGSHQRRLTDSPRFEGLSAYSPTGRKIVFERDTSSDNVYVMRADGSHQKPLTEGPENHRAPDWGPRP